MDKLSELLVILKEPRSLVAESYRGVRTSLQRALSNDVKTIMFVSCFAGDGKSMLCANVAVALTQLFLDVILVDADLRRPTLTSLFEATDRPGLGDYLSGTAELSQILNQTPLERLRLVPAGMATENPGNLLGRTTLSGFCSKIAQEGDAVIIDTSPLAACNDALSLGQHIDTTVMVVSPRRWDGDVEVRIRQTLEQHKVPLMGVVLNGSTGGSSYGAYGYGYGYGARSQALYNYGITDESRALKRRGLWKSLKGLFGPD